MEKKDYSQLDLFSQPQKNASNENRRVLSTDFINRCRRHEKALLTIIGIIICSLVSFSLGVEKGKRIASLNLNHRIDTAFIQQPAKPKAMAQPAIKTMPAATIMLQQPQYPPSQQAQSSKGQAYTIQLASYKSNSHAQKEAAVLKQKGYSPLLLTKGEYIVLCVGNFSNKQNAQSLLPELSKRYGDCRIRRL